MGEALISKNLSQKRILVTGGSRGIGAGIARELAARGASVAITYASREDAAKAVLETLPKPDGAPHLAVQLNLSDEASVNKAVETVLEKWQGLDGLVNNAGLTKDGLLLRMKTEEFDEVINANLRGTFLVTRACLKTFMKARAGSIVHITSIIGATGNAGQANYAASKAGVESFSRSVALEMASRNVRSNCIAPGFINTEMTDVLSDAHKTAILSKIPLGRIAETQEVAAPVAFLLSDESRYVTGHTLSVNGGMFMN